ncbi:DUF4405 domain-containing protein [Palleronia rufa]|uniref:DUF4405 domain-containing protein n=1 Tax=Palleronia rufa TaxID=1530186 RepID=UPI001F1F3E36|nr:DUF4405 domain-containing protein [Palleronia rufa]
MFKPFRLLLDCGAALCLLLAMAYFWQGNIAHELFGTAFALVLIWHNINNRAWYRWFARGRHDLRRVVGVVLNIALLLLVLTLLATGLSISRGLYADLPLPGRFALRELHWFVAWWTVVIAGAHVGLHWPRVRTIASLKASRLLWIPGAFLLMAGLQGTLALGLPDFLTFRYGGDFLQMAADPAAFFRRLLAMILGAAVAVHGLLVAVEISRGRLEKRHP